MIHGMSIPGAIEAAQRKRGFTKGVFGWLRHAPWGNPAFSGMFMSLVLFGFLGGISGVVLGTEQINLLMHNTLYVPGHFHATVVAGTTLAFMAVTYLAVPLIFQRELILPKVAQWQPYVFAIGVSGTALFMMGAGTLGVARRHWDITFNEATLSFDYPGTAFLMMGLNGISGLLAGLGGAMFVVVVVGSLLFGKKRGAAEVEANPIVADSRQGGNDLRRCRHFEAAGHDHPGDDLLPVLRPLLLHQLEVPLGGLAAELRTDPAIWPKQWSAVSIWSTWSRIADEGGAPRQRGL